MGITQGIDLYEVPYCVAIYKDYERTVWAAGFGTGFKYRHPAAKMALAIALGKHWSKLEEVSSFFPEIGVMLATAGLVDRKFFTQQMTPKQEQERARRLHQRLVEGGRGGGFNDRQEVMERKTFVDDSGLDEFGRRISKPGASSATQKEPTQEKTLTKAERAKAALERLKKKGQARRSRSRS